MLTDLGIKQLPLYPNIYSRGSLASSQVPVSFFLHRNVHHRLSPNVGLRVYRLPPEVGGCNIQSHPGQRECARRPHA